ncbi:sigma-70 family RNA polymerase sigma factor [Faecalicatena sp. AGMB00832]|uniref:Sigma-70 family RNA polymerase sigma factor n=1 Tax=Faecalicatena faecalis TaxID=2726362 RepID=A0ABS6CZQ1_9FIRM|nr:sigma-70 family RNA polymerase sigma factor [Faecalicatena faecalis]MBU3874817.1 sigma-70 family RNA polymerase sigma factor [Faecalicatena faecalis]
MKQIEEILENDISIPDGVEVTEPLKIYLKEIAQIPQLSENEERELGKRIAQGDMDARQQMEEANLRLVVSIAGEYVGRGMQFMDLVQEGNIGLMQAAAQYNGNTTKSFSAFAVPWIKEEMDRALDELSEEIRVPAYVAENMKRVQNTSRELKKELGREAKASEIAQKLGDKTEEEIESILAMLKNPAVQETDGSAQDSDGDEFAEEEEDRASQDAVASLIRKEEVEELLSHLNEKEKKVIRMRFGLEDGKPHPVEEVAEQLGITAGEIGQIEIQAMQKLRSAGNGRSE